MSYKWSQRGLNNLRRQSTETIDAVIVFNRGGVTLPAQTVSLRRVSQQDVNENEPISIGGATLEIRGNLETFDVQQDDTFPWDGQRWRVTQPAVATGTNTSVARRTLAVMVV